MCVLERSVGAFIEGTQYIEERMVAKTGLVGSGTLLNATQRYSTLLNATQRYSATARLM